MRFTVDTKRENDLFETFCNFKEEFEKKGIIFHRLMQDENGVFVTFLFADGNDDRLVEFLWDIVLYFKNGSYPEIEKVAFVLGKKEIKLHPIYTAVS
ncbi:MAG: hypothetical protein WC878_01380 [Candidatus Paceibacterota bacterium]